MKTFTNKFNVFTVFILAVFLFYSLDSFSRNRDSDKLTMGPDSFVSSPTAALAELSIEIDSDDVDCYAGSDGSATALVSGGTPPLAYLWSDGQTTATATGLWAGTYNVTVTDLTGETITGSATINEPTMLSLEIESDDVDCYGGLDGSATALVSGGTAPYTYLWTDGQTTATATGLSAGTYTVTVTDSEGCTITGSATIEEPTQLFLEIESDDVDCFGGSDGSATALVSGGTAPYTYLWSDGQTTATATGLSPGTYTVTVTDANECTITGYNDINMPRALFLEIESDDVDCYGGLDGSATALVSGGTAPYTYLWTDGQTTATATGLSAGTYTVTVTDSEGCTITGSATIEEPTQLFLEIESVDVDCYGGLDGSATALVSGGTAPYTYLWTDGQTTATATGLSAGTYTVTVTDSEGCTITGSATIEEPTQLFLEIESVDVVCYDRTDGSATTLVSGGTAPYTYLWSDGQTTATAAGLSAGTYNVTVTDSEGCTITGSATIEEPTQLFLEIESDDVDCYGGLDGSATALVSGGTAPYTYLWSDGQTIATATGLSPGTYTVIVTDDHECINTGTITIDEPTALALEISSDDVDCTGGSDGSAAAIVSGGTAPYTYLWSDGQTTATATGLSAGTYAVTVTDAHGCLVGGTVDIGTIPDVTPPTIVCPSEINMTNDAGLCSAIVYFTPTVTDNCEVASVVCTPTSGSTFPVGTTTVNCVAMDAAGNMNDCSFIVTVTDNEAPDLVVVSTPITLWPPNHKYETIDMDEIFVSVDDNCSELSIDDVYITSVTSDEAEDAPGGEDGNTTDDIVIDSDCGSVDLRKERKENGNGRVYTIYLAVDDGNGNTGTASCRVHVPKSNNGTAIDDGMAYEEECNKSSFVDIANGEVELVNYPNPFNGSTTITFTLTDTDITTLKVYDTYGKQVATLFDGLAESGQQYTFDFNGANLSKGIYVYHLQSGNNVSVVKKMILMK